MTVRVPCVTLTRVVAQRGQGEPLDVLAERVVAAAVEKASGPIGGVLVATFSNPQRFPSLAVRLAARLGLSADTPAFDLQMACSAFPYAVYVAGRLSADTGRTVLVVDGDVQSSLVDPADHATGNIFSDAVTATLVKSSPDDGEESAFSFLSRYDEALTCGADGPIRMDGFRVFGFVATQVSAWLKEFVAACGGVGAVDAFVPHQANPYMIRRLADTLGLTDRLLSLDPACKNPGSCSIPMTLASSARPDLSEKRILIAGFGAGYSASAGIVRMAPDCLLKTVMSPGRY